LKVRSQSEANYRQSACGLPTCTTQFLTYIDLILRTLKEDLVSNLPIILPVLTAFVKG
jgi:hypothetical protein